MSFRTKPTKPRKATVRGTAARASQLEVFWAPVTVSNELGFGGLVCGVHEFRWSFFATTSECRALRLTATETILSKRWGNTSPSDSDSAFVNRQIIRRAVVPILKSGIPN